MLKTPLFKTRYICGFESKPKVTLFDLNHKINPVSYPLHQRRLYEEVLI